MARLADAALSSKIREGQLQTKPAQIPAGASGITVFVSREDWPRKDGATVRDREVLRATIMLSLNDGVTWQKHAAFGTPGGIHKRTLRAEIPNNAMILVDIHARERIRFSVEIESWPT